MFLRTRAAKMAGMSDPAGIPLSLEEARLAAEQVRESRGRYSDPHNWPWVIEELVRRVESAEGEAERLRRMVAGMADRVAAQSELLLRRAEAAVSLTPGEARAVLQVLGDATGHSPENVFSWDGADDGRDPMTSMAVKVFRACGRRVPDGL